jgi:hypothetical protein
MIITVVTSYLRNEENVYSLFDLIDLTDMPAILKTHSPVVLWASSTTKTGHHDIAEVLLKVALNTKNQIKLIYYKIETK